MSLSLADWLPAANAGLIVISGIFLLTGFAFIRQGKVVWHRRCMLTASGFAVLFLIVYVTRAIILPTKFFPDEGAIRNVYLTLLVSHILVAIAIVPLAVVTLRRALAGRFVLHRQIARITLPLWLYVAVTGWAVYMMLYHLS